MFFGETEEMLTAYSEAEALTNKLSFSFLCDILEQIEDRRNSKIKIDSKDAFNMIFTTQLRSKLNNASLFPLLRLLIPERDCR